MTAPPTITGYTKAGSAASSFGYSGEQTDSNGFVFLRARYYQPGMGRFTQMDPSRQERNAYLYSAGNPVAFVDPSGLIADPRSNPYYSTWTEAEEAFKVITEIKARYGMHIDVDFGWSGIFYYQDVGANGETASLPTPVFIEYGGSLMHLLGKINCLQWELGEWTLDELGLVKQAIEDMVTTFARYGGDGSTMFRKAMGTPKIVQKEAVNPLRSNYNMVTDTLVFEPGIFNYARGTILHEFGHTWNWKTGRRLARQMREAVGYGSNYYCWEFKDPCIIVVREAASEPPGIRTGMEDIDRAYLAMIHEDWANSFAAFIDPYLPAFSSKGTSLNDVRKRFIEEEMRKLR